MSTTRCFLASPAEAADWLKRLAIAKPVFFPQRAGASNFAFKPVGPHAELGFGPSRPTLVPPSRRLLPDNELLYEFERLPDGGYAFTPGPVGAEQVLAGVRPCDLKAIAQLDRVMAAPPADPLYPERRQRTAIVGLACVEPCDERSFCAAVDSLDWRQGADVMLVPGQDGLTVEVRTEQGEELVAGAGFAPCSEGIDQGRPEAAPFGRQLAAPLERIAELMAAHDGSPVYDRYAERCFSCGTCNLVCPTCYCFEIADDLELDCSAGRRLRTWDSCMIPGFAVVAGGHNFRPTAASRQRHRLRRKFAYLPQRFGTGSFCVGCGRCGRQCTSGIDIYDMVNDLIEEEGR